MAKKKKKAGKPGLKKAGRVRRRPEDAQALILDAAETVMAKGEGPAALRLQDVARAAGVSHPTILHHFGSREGLVRALNLRALGKLTATAISGMSQTESSMDGVGMSFATYRDGLAQRIVWLIQSADLPPGGPALFEEVVEKFHQVRKSFARPGNEPDIADTRAVIHLITIAAFGDALIGPRLREAGGKEAQTRRAFEHWFSALIDMFLSAKAN
ncbi:MAG TPA: helix-turn-helix domain-containing protein [Rhizomicrobium sp.]|nr:helix-turn-helix domain-containing protein [Rhizomicrobium sp.]